MVDIVRSKSFRDAFLLLLAGGVLWVAGVATGMPATVYAFLAGDDQLGADYLLYGLLVGALLVLTFGALRVIDLGREIRRRDEAERDARWISAHDMLTRLQNRKGLAMEVVRLRETGQTNVPWVSFCINIDGIGAINSVAGTEVGDAVLIEIAQRLRKLFPDNTLARLGSDEFFAAQRRLAGYDYNKMADRIIKMLGQPIMVDGAPYDVGLFIGIARYPEDAANIEHLIRCADAAMRVAKRSGDGCCRWFEPSVDVAIFRRAQLDKELRAALKSQSIVPHYQPEIDLKSGRIIGFEALARWRLPDGQEVLPEEFIRLAEETGLIHELFDQLLRRASADAVGWPAWTMLAFNVSPVQLADPRFVSRILDILRETGLPARRLEIEVTESALTRDVPTAQAVLEGLRAAGIRIALDDFGTGYSSLSLLAQLHVDKLKIDRSFVASFQDDDRQANIVRAILGLGRGLGVVTIAEGIEELDQAELLMHLGCHEGQGYLFGRALPAEEALALARPRAFPARIEPIRA